MRGVVTNLTKKVRKQMSNIEIFEQRIDDIHLDSYWYDGLIAKGKIFELRALGEVDFQGKEPENDNDVSLMYENCRFNLNNWFEINEIDSEYSGGEVYGNYDEAIEALIKLEKEQANAKN